MIQPMLAAHWLQPRFRYRQLGKIHAARLALAFLASHLIASFLNEPHAVWMSITLMVVMGGQAHTGSIVEKGRQRLLGTTYGAIGGFAVILAGHASPSLALALLASFIAAGGYLAIGRGGYIALLSCITVVIVASSSTLDIGFWRMVNVYAGVVLALVFAHLLPERAREHWYFLLEETIEGLDWLYREWAQGNGFQTALADGLSKRQASMRGLIAATARETGCSAQTLTTVLRQLHRVQISIEFLAGQDRGAKRAAQAADDAETAVAESMARLGALMGLPAHAAVPLPGSAPGPEQRWLTGELARHLQELEQSLTPLLPRLAGGSISRENC